MKNGALFTLLFVFAVLGRTVFAKSATETYEDLKTKIQKEFGNEASLRSPMEYMIFTDVIRQEYARGAQRPTFLLNTTIHPTNEITSIMKRVSSITNVPYAIIHIENLLSKESSAAVESFRAKLVEVLPDASQRFRIAIVIPKKRLDAKGSSFFTHLTEALTVNAFTYKNARISIENVDFIFYLSDGPWGNFLTENPRRNNTLLKNLLIGRYHFPNSFVQRMRKVFPLLEPGCKVDLAD